MKGKRLLKLLGEVDERYIDDAAPTAPSRQVWKTWVAAAACLALVVGIALPLLNDISGKQADSVVEPLLLLIEYDNAYYEIVDNKKLLERRGIDSGVGAEDAGEHIAYFTRESEYSNYVLSDEPTAVELLEYAAAPCKAVRILRRGNEYSIVLFCNFWVPNEECLDMSQVLSVYGITGAEDISAVTPVKDDSGWPPTGSSITDSDSIAGFYSALNALEPYSQDSYDRLEFGGIDESRADEYYSAHADDARCIMIETAAGLRFTLRYYPSYGWVYASAGLTYYKISPRLQAWLEENCR